MRPYILFLIPIFFVACASVQKYEPMQLTITADNTTGFINLKTQVHCTVIGGNAPYSYLWSINYSKISLDQCGNQSNCIVSIDTIGDYKLGCEVKDAASNALKDEIMLTVAKMPVKIDTIVTFGDSLTYGYSLNDHKNSNWAALYRKEFQSAYLFNYAQSGATTEDIKNQLILFGIDSKSYNFSEKRNLIFIWIGANDIINFVSVSQFKSNYYQILSQLISLPNTQIILINIPDVTKLSVADSVEQGVNQLVNGFGISLNLKKLSRNIISNYNNAINDTANEFNLKVIDMFSYLDTFDPSLVSSDGFHPNVEGHKMIMEKIKEEVIKDYPAIDFY